MAIKLEAPVVEKAGAMSPVELASGLFLARTRVPVAIRIVNLYLLRSREGWILVDCGVDSEQSFLSLTGALAAVGAKLTDLRLILVTHCHIDHAGMAQTLRQLSGAELILHRSTVDWVDRLYGPYAERRQDVEDLAIRNGLPPDDLADLHAFNRRHTGFGHRGPCDRIVSDYEEIRIGEFTFRVVPTPGHAPDHICFEVEERGWLFAGDHLLRHITPNVGLTDPRLTDPLADFVGSLHRTAEIDTRLVLPGHGPHFNDAARRSTALLGHHERRAATVRSIVERNELTAFEVTRALFGRRRLSHDQRHLAFTETLAHLEYLRKRGALEAVDRDGVVAYRGSGR